MLALAIQIVQTRKSNAGRPRGLGAEQPQWQSAARTAFLASAIYHLHRGRDDGAEQHLAQ
jgi:hypothetical protein